LPGNAASSVAGISQAIEYIDRYFLCLKCIRISNIQTDPFLRAFNHQFIVDCSYNAMFQGERFGCQFCDAGYNPNLLVVSTRHMVTATAFHQAEKDIAFIPKAAEIQFYGLEK
jgi:hypothetical protein